MTAELVACPGFPGFYVTPDGTVLDEYGTPLRVYTHERTGGRSVRFPTRPDGSQPRRYLHRLVLEAYVGPPPTDDAVASLVDGDFSNISPDRVFWTTLDAANRATRQRKDRSDVRRKP